MALPGPCPTTAAWAAALAPAAHAATCFRLSPFPPSFDPASRSFTLNSVMTLRLDAVTEFVAELAVNAAKEAAIEASLASIAATWGALALDMAEYKVRRRGGAGVRDG
jgi:hypothetical protein